MHEQKTTFYRAHGRLCKVGKKGHYLENKKFKKNLRNQSVSYIFATDRLQIL